MVRNLLVLLMFLGVGFGASVAQSDIFVRQSPKADSKGGDDVSKKKPIYLRPFKSSPQKTQRVNKKVSVPRITSGMPQQVAGDLKLLAYWQKAERMPETVKELQSYGQALRALDLKRVMEERNKILPALEAQAVRQVNEYRKEFLKQAPDLEAFVQINDMIVKGLDVADMLSDPNAAAKAVYTRYAGESVEVIEAEARKRAQQADKVVKPIYLQPDAKATNNPDSKSKAATGVYKNYR
ncbi:MAG: hypothetical protein GW778_05070 [Alphaproteobacteria bacterium]|nr:hypothetical protein [Alphaproteobacteria bacterium]